MPAFLEPINIPTRINKPPIKFGTRNTWLNPSIRDLKIGYVHSQDQMTLLI